MDFSLDQNSTRAKRAAYRQSLGGQGTSILGAAFGGLSLVAGTLILLQGSSLGWLVLLPAAVIFAFYLWYRGNLANIPAGNYDTPGVTLLHEAIEPGTLAGLRKASSSSYDLWKALEPSEERWFLHNRYEIDESFFEHLLDKNAGSIDYTWRQAHRLHQKYPQAGYSNMLLLAALVASVPNVDNMLRNAGLELEDVETGIPWMHDIHAKRVLAHSKKNFGGVGRDWAFGYTPILRTLGHNISEGIERHGFFSDTSMHESIVRQMAQIMGSSNSTVTLVGDEGVGKTTCVYAFAEQLLADSSMPKRIRYSQIIQLDASTLIAHAQRPGELEQLMIQTLNEAHRAKNIILFFDDAQAFFGQGGIDLSQVLMPALESSSVRMIFAMNPQSWQKLANSGVAAKLSPVNVPPADEENTLAILRDQVATVEYRHKIVFTYQALREAYKLGSRYVTNQAMPGAALSVLQQAASTTQQQLVTKGVLQRAAEQSFGIKLQTADAGESDNLLNLEASLKAQVISQERAIEVVANALRRSRSGVGNPDRPIGTFLFLGPTGVGKTELSKALARSYFGDESAMIRVDMNQYVSAGDVERLISPTKGSELSFLGEVRKKPFSVILMDEIEKAHQSVINALLQMLDEGMMRDSDNRSVSFRDSIIIATSNAGADEIRKYIEEGKDLAELETTFTDTLISKGSFAPEFLNRFDEVVLFKPLSQEELVKVIDLIIAGINKTLDAQKVSVELTEEAKKWLVAKGYDAKLGARPMRRMAQRYVENIVAKQLLSRKAGAGTAIKLDVKDFEEQKG